MALQDSGPISLSDVRSELKSSGRISLGDDAVRKLAKRLSGSVSLSHLYGKADEIREPETGWNAYRGSPTLMRWQVQKSGFYFVEWGARRYRDYKFSARGGKDVLEHTAPDGWTYIRGPVAKSYSSGSKDYQVARKKSG